MLDDKDIDAIVIAIPNDWHALATTWGLQAGKHVYVEKPASHTVWEGRRMVEAMQRLEDRPGRHHEPHRPAIQQAIKFMKDGRIGKGTWHAACASNRGRPSASTRRADGGGREASSSVSEATTNEPTYDTQYLLKVNYDLWICPRRSGRSSNRFHYNWHWHWITATATPAASAAPVRHRAVGPRQAGAPGQGLLDGRLLRATSPRRRRRHADALFEYTDGEILEIGTRGESTNDEGGQRIGNIFYGTKGWLWTEESGRVWQSYMGPMGAKNEKGPESASQTAEAQGLTTIEFAHYQNFIDAIRSNDPKMLACDIMEGHLSSTLPHLANISYRVGHGLTFNGKTETFENDKAADKLLTREYRKGFEIPSLS